MRSGTELARKIQLTDWSRGGEQGKPVYRSSGVQIPRDIYTRFVRYLYSTKCSWIIKLHMKGKRLKVRNSLKGVRVS